MALRLKDRIEANIRQSDKVNTDLKIYLQGSNTTYLYTYNGSEAKSVFIYPEVIGALATSGGTMTGILELAGTGPWHGIRRSLEIQRKTTDATYKEGYTWTSANADDSTKTDVNVLGENNDGFHIYTYYTPPYGYVKTTPDNSTGSWVSYGVAALRMQSVDYGTGNFSDYYTEYRLPTNRAGLTSDIINYFNTSSANIGGVNKPVYVSEHGRLVAGNTFVPTTGGTFSGAVYYAGDMVRYGDSGYYTYMDYYRRDCAGTAGATSGYTWASGNTGAWLAWSGYAIGGIETNGTETKSYGTYWATRAYSINSITGAKLSYYYTFRMPSVPNDLTANATRYITSSSSTARGGSNQPVYLSGGYLYTCNTFVPNTGGTFTGNITISGAYYPSFELAPTTANSTTATYPKAVFEGSYADNVSMWIWGDKTNSAKSRRGLVLYNYSAQSDPKKALALRQCDTSGNWQSDLYILHSGNYTDYIPASSGGNFLPLSGGAVTGQTTFAQDILVGGGNDNYGVHPWTNNYSTLGKENLKWYKVYATYIYGSTVYGAVWNDYAEFRKTVHSKPGRVVVEKGDGSLCQAWDRLLPGCEVVSDTYGFAIGETDDCKTPIAVSGRVLAYPYEDRDSYKPGDAVCSAPGGCVSRMTRQEITMYPERIIGTVSEIPDYKNWGTGNVEVDGRIWIRIR